MRFESRENYMRAIYFLLEKNGVVTSVGIAKYLKISKPAVSEMLKRLKEEKLVSMEPYSKILLTVKGLRIAKKMTYKHRLTELFLYDVLKVDKKYVHIEAHKLEHALSDKVLLKMRKLLNNPGFCPHGSKISME